MTYLDATRSAVQGGVAAALGSWPAPAVAVRVFDTDATTLASDAGFADLAARRPLTSADRFQIGSISKSFTGLVVASLADEGQLDLSAPLTAYLPWFTVRSTFAPITLRHLLHHTAGLITGSDALPDALPHAWSARDTETGSPPGELFHYSNLGYVLLGLVIEAVSGRPLAEVVTERILVPVGMNSSTAAITDDDHPRLSVGYQSLSQDRPWLPGDPLVPATWLQTATADGNIAATADDLARFARMLLGGGRVEGRQVVSAATFASVTGDLATGGEPSEHFSRYGLGINTERVNGHTWLTHGGGMIGYSTFLAVDLDAGLGVVALTNAPGEWPVGELIARPVLATALGAGFTEHASPLQARTVINDAERFVGEYVTAGHRIMVEAANGGLRLRDDAGSGQLYETAQGRLACDHPSWRLFTHRLTGTGDERRWLCGSLELAPGHGDEPSEDERSTEAHPLVGAYRCYSPWYPSFRILQRSGRLHLAAVAGVEAHTDEPELVEIAPRTYRIGSDPLLPERLQIGPTVANEVVWVERDGCRYGRCFRT